MLGQILALSSGILAALASTCGKLAVAADDALWLCEKFCDKLSIEFELAPSGEHLLDCKSVIVYFRIGCFVMIFILNALMWTTFVKALHLCESSLEATVTNTAANLFFTAVIGQVIFREPLSPLWWLGSVCIIIGLLLLHHGNKNLYASIIEKKKS